MNDKTEYVITCKLTPDTDPYVLAYNEGNDGYFWTEKENIERLREQNVPPHRFIFENFHEAKTVRNIVNNCSFKCGIVPLSFLYEPSYTIIHRKNPDVYDIMNDEGKIVFTRNHPDNIFFFISTHKGKYDFQDERTEEAVNG